MNKLYQFCKDRSKLNMSIDIVMFLVLMAMAGIGLLIKYVLVSGVTRNAIYGDNIDLEFWGMDRHEWGTIHLYLSISFLVLIVLHIILHWKMILCILKRMIPHKGVRIAFEWFVSVLGVLLFLFAFIIQPEQVYHEHIYRHRTERFDGKTIAQQNDRDAQEVEVSEDKVEVKTSTIDKSVKHERTAKLEQHRSEVEEYEVNGTLTLQAVSEKYNVPSDFLCSELNIPKRFSNERLGRLRRRYGFTMSDVSQAISKYKKQNS
jgi:hypothetical protein